MGQRIFPTRCSSDIDLLWRPLSALFNSFLFPEGPFVTPKITLLRIHRAPVEAFQVLFGEV